MRKPKEVPWMQLVVMAAERVPRVYRYGGVFIGPGI